MSGFHNYEQLDKDEVLRFLFHPRNQDPGRQGAEGRTDFMIPVGQGAMVGASLHFKSPEAPVVLFFHGNGEIVSDYDDLGQLFVRDGGVNFFVADYRGYGVSTGKPGVRAMMKDCHAVQAFLVSYMEKTQMTGKVCIMGRSLGSAPALELASRSVYPVSSLIVESGFALALPLLKVLGLDPDSLGIREENGFENLDRIKEVNLPCLIIHAQFDHLIPFSDAQALFDACPSARKYLLEIKGANHNDIFFRGMGPYLEQVSRFCSNSS